MRVILGPFHPHLEDALVDEVLGYRNADSLCPLMVLVPSDSLRRRLKVLLASERQLNLLNLHILTFHQLSLRLFEEVPGANSLALHDDAFLEEVLRQIIRMGHQGTSAFSGIEERIGGCAALWQTLRDLKDGMVEPNRALEALNEGHFGHEASERISDLFRLYQTFLSCCEQWGIRDYADLDNLVMGQVLSSEFLKQFRQIFYYGFYDLTQVQVDLFQSVARHYPTTLLFPLVHRSPKHPAWAFAQRFYERYVHGLPSDSSQIRKLAGDSDPSQGSIHSAILPLFVDESDGFHHSAPGDLRCTIINCSGARDEVLTVAKEILRLVSDEGIAFHEIGVAARNLTPYVPWIKEVFPEHRIPVTTSAEEPLVQFPLVKAVHLLVSLVLKDYLRSHFVDLVSSPFFNTRLFCRAGVAPRPDLWDILTRRLGITKGLEEWRRLQRHLNREVVLAESENKDGDPKRLIVSADQLRILWGLFIELHRDLSALPYEASWSQYISAWKVLLEKYLGISDEGETPPRSREDQAREATLNTLEGLAGLDTVSPKTSLPHFIQTFERWLERSSISFMDWNVNGVAVLDAMAARGVPYRVLFILGLNEGMFPRTIREDAFLRDRHRRVLETVLGYKVSEKLAAFDEEKLLFTLLGGAARERLYCLYQRSDENGRALAPSWYLAELRRAVWGEEMVFAGRETTIPRGIVEKQRVEPFTRKELLLPPELAVRLGLESQDPTSLVELEPVSAPLYRRGRRAMEQLEATGGRLSEYDGSLGPLPEYWNRLCEQGVSPTALERYALCPFQFYACNVLRLGRLERPEEIVCLGPSDVGKLSHVILKSFYQELMDRGYFVSNDSSFDVRAILDSSARRTFSDYGLENPVGYPVAWEILQEELTNLLGHVVAQDLRELSESGYRPLVLEIEAKERLKGEWPVSLKGLNIHGRMDRIDHQPEHNRYRVVDYKLRSGRNRSPVDSDLRRSALRGQRLQPPFYLLLGKRFASERSEGALDPTVEVAFYFLAPKWPERFLVAGLFPADGWDGRLGEGIKETVSLLLEGIHEGRFFIRPGPYCQHCEVSEVCRKNHLPTRWRAENDPEVMPHRDLRKKSLTTENSAEGSPVHGREGKWP